MNSATRICVAVVGIALATGCASVPRASKEQDVDAKQFKAPPNKANVYVFRDETFGGNNGLDILLDGRLIGTTTHHTFILAQVEPGPHKVMSRAENDVWLDFTAEAGKCVYVWQEVKFGVLSARATLHLVDEVRGKAGVFASELVQSPKP